MMRWETGDKRARLHCSSENWGLEEARCAKCILLCLVANLLFKMSSSEAKKNSTVKWVWLLYSSMGADIGSNGLSYHRHFRHVKKQSSIGFARLWVQNYLLSLAETGVATGEENAYGGWIDRLKGKVCREARHRTLWVSHSSYLEKRCRNSLLETEINRN